MKGNLPEDVCSCAGGKVNGGTVGGAWARRNDVKKLLEGFSNNTVCSAWEYVLSKLGNA